METRAWRRSRDSGRTCLDFGGRREVQGAPWVQEPGGWRLGVFLQIPNTRPLVLWSKVDGEWRAEWRRSVRRGPGLDERIAYGP